jgi:hypothetical protein
MDKYVVSSKHPILFIFSTNIRTEYFKHAAHSSSFSLQNAVYFIMLPFLFLYYSHFTYRMCSNLNAKFRFQTDKIFSISGECACPSLKTARNNDLVTQVDFYLLGG